MTSEVKKLLTSACFPIIDSFIHRVHMGTWEESSEDTLKTHKLMKIPPMLP